MQWDLGTAEFGAGRVVKKSLALVSTGSEREKRLWIGIVLFIV